MSSLCVVTPEVAGVGVETGVGLAMGELAARAAGWGHQVTLLHAAPEPPEPLLSRLRQEWSARGVELAHLDPDPAVEAMNPRHTAVSLRTYRWLRQRSFDHVHFAERGGIGYFSVQARRLDAAFRATRITVSLFGPSALARQDERRWPLTVDDLETDFMERRSGEGADAVTLASRYLQRRLWAAGWRVPANAPVLPAPLLEPSSDRRGGAEAGDAGAQPVRELVFFGPLSAAEGLVAFCDALDLLAADGVRPDRVVFLGAPGPVAGEDAIAYLRRRAARWPFAAEQAFDGMYRGRLARLTPAAGRVAVVLSPTAKAGHRVLACLAAGVPVLAARSGAPHELLDHVDGHTPLLRGAPGDLAVTLRKVLERGAAPARPSPAASGAADAWRRWFEAHGGERRPVRRVPRRLPLVSVCLTHFDRPAMLRQAVESLRNQDYPHMEVILVDDGSTEAAARDLLAELEPEFSLRRWRIVRLPHNVDIGAARNAGPSVAHGEFLLFMDDDNVARPSEVGTLVRAAMTSGADIVTCAFEVFTGDAPPEPPAAVWAPVGGCLAAGAFHNCFGDSNALIRRTAFEALHGFSEDRGLGHEDHELFARALLAGYRLEAVPEPCFAYRRSPGQVSAGDHLYGDHVRGLRPYEALLPPEARGALLLAQGQAFRIRQLENALAAALRRPTGG